MDSLLKNAVSGALGGGSSSNENNNSNNNEQSNNNQSSSSEQSGSGLMGLVNKATSGATSKQEEDALGKGIDYVQEKFLGQGDQSKEGVMDEAQDEMIEGVIRSGYKTATGKDFFIANK